MQLQLQLQISRPSDRNSTLGSQPAYRPAYDLCSRKSVIYRYCFSFATCQTPSCQQLCLCSPCQLGLHCLGRYTLLRRTCFSWSDSCLLYTTLSTGSFSRQVICCCTAQPTTLGNFGSDSSCAVTNWSAVSSRLQLFELDREHAVVTIVWCPIWAVQISPLCDAPFGKQTDVNTV